MFLAVLMTREPVAPDCWGKYLLATFWALIDSYPLGRKLALLFEVTETICGEKARTTTAATTQAAMTFHGLLMTTRPSAANTGSPLVLLLALCLAARVEHPQQRCPESDRQAWAAAWKE